MLTRSASYFSPTECCHLARQQHYYHTGAENIHCGFGSSNYCSVAWSLVAVSTELGLFGGVGVMRLFQRAAATRTTSTLRTSFITRGRSQNIIMSIGIRCAYVGVGERVRAYWLLGWSTLLFSLLCETHQIFFSEHTRCTSARW